MAHSGNCNTYRVGSKVVQEGLSVLSMLLVRKPSMMQLSLHSCIEANDLKASTAAGACHWEAPCVVHL